jgi:hypothetical protein
MDKRKIIIFTIISTLFSLFIILFTYFGIIRYIQLKISSESENYIKNYSKLNRYEENDKKKGKIVILKERKKTNLKLKNKWKKKKRILKMIAIIFLEIKICRYK